MLTASVCWVTAAQEWGHCCQQSQQTLKQNLVMCGWCIHSVFRQSVPLYLINLFLLEVCAQVKHLVLFWNESNTDMQSIRQPARSSAKQWWLAATADEIYLFETRIWQENVFLLRKICSSMARNVSHTTKICSGKCCCSISPQIMLKRSHFLFSCIDQTSQSDYIAHETS